MPLLDSDVNDVAMNNHDIDDGFRPRASSTGTSGIRNFFRKKHKSAEGGGSPGSAAPGSKVKNFFDNMRPRNKSGDNSNAVPKKRSGAVDTHFLGKDDRRQRSQSVYERGLFQHISSSPGYGTPMSQLLVADSNAVHPGQDGYTRNQLLLDLQRARAYSDPKPRLRQAALQARNSMMAKRVCLIFRSFFFTFLMQNGRFNKEDTMDINPSQL